jgi:hypothetical protein
MNLLFDYFNIPNLDQDYELNSYSYFLHEDCLVPELFKPIKHIIKCYTVDQIDELDFFIYPINLCDQGADSKINHSGKFLTDIDELVLDKVKNSKGVILIDATYEPFTKKSCLLLKDKIRKLLYTDNVYINTKISSLYSNDSFFTNFPSFLELHTTTVKYDDQIKITTNKKFCLFGSRIDKHIGGLNLIKWLKEKNLISLGHISLSRITADINSYDSILPFIDMDVLNYVKFNIVVEAWFTTDPNYRDHPMLTEKIFRNIHYRKPFILIGQHSALEEFRILGYKTYDELFDESYDTEKDSDTRLQKVFTQIQKLIDEPDDFWQKNKDKLDAIHKHNLDNYENRLTKLQKFYDTLSQR